MLLVTLYITELWYLPMTTITILAILAILGGVATLSITGFTVIGSVVAQTTGDNATMSGNMTGGNATGGNTTEASGTISGTMGDTLID
jgi:hypothetical protein